MKHLGKTVLNGLILGAAAGALTVGFASKSFAGAIAYSGLQITNFQILAEDGSPLTAGTFDVLRIENFTAAEARQNGSGPTADDITGGASDVPLQCTGSCGGIGENEFFQQGAPIGQFSRADAQLFGNSLAGSLTANSVAEVHLNVPSDGSASSNVGTTSRFSFTPGEEGALRIRFNATPELLALLEDPEFAAGAGMAWRMDIRPGGGGTPLFSFAPDGVLDPLAGEVLDPFQLNDSLGVNGPGELAYNPGTGLFEVVTPSFAADQELQFSIFHETTSSARLGAPTPTPEPAAAALLGVGLLGLVGLRRRIRR